MIKKSALLFFLLLSIFAFSSNHKTTSASVVVIEITDTTLSDVYYHQQNFGVPTKLVFTNLTSVSGYVYFHNNINLVEVDFPQLTQTGGYFYCNGNTDLTRVNAPNLNTVHQYLYVVGNTALTELNVCGLSNILEDPEPFGSGINPYYYIQGNTPAVDATPHCFSIGAPTNFVLSNNTVNENEPINTPIGTFSADVPSGSVTYYTDQYANGPYNPFKLVGNQLFTNQTFDYETNREYTITVGARNQIGEKIEQTFTIYIQDVAGEGINTIEITDTTLEGIMYSQYNFTGPTKLVFTNLTSVSGMVYFGNNTNLVEVDLPLLTQTGGYFYCNANSGLTRLNAPNLNTVHQYLYVAGNPALTELNVCGLNNIIEDPEPYGGGNNPYYYIQGNTPAVDATPHCFSIGAPTNLILSNNTVNENEAIHTLIGTFSADVPSGSVSYYTDQYANGPYSPFTLVGNQLFTNQSFDYEANHEYSITVGARNQIGEKIEQTFTINIQDVATEVVSTVEITDATLDSIMYSRYNFVGPTKLVFTNLTSVSGMVYFGDNTNLVEVDLPLLTQTGSYFYCNGNTGITRLNAPNLNTVHDYLYVASNQSLTELNVCGLTQIIATNEYEPYYYIQNNPLLNFDSTCLENTVIVYNPVTEVVVVPNQNTLIGHFSSNTSASMRYFFINENGTEVPNTDFIIDNNNLYLAHNYEYYTNPNLNIRIGAIRNGTTLRSTLTQGLNQKIELQVNMNIENATLGIPTIKNENAVLLYPNPAANDFEIQSKEAIQSIEMYDMTGRKIRDFEILLNNKIDVSNIPNGNYIVRMNTVSKNVVIRKLLIQK